MFNGSEPTAADWASHVAFGAKEKAQRANERLDALLKCDYCFAMTDELVSHIDWHVANGHTTMSGSPIARPI